MLAVADSKSLMKTASRISISIRRGGMPSDSMSESARWPKSGRWNWLEKQEKLLGANGS